MLRFRGILNVLKIKLGYVIQLLNWYSIVNKNNQETVDASEKWSKPIGFYSKLNLSKRTDLNQDQIKEIYEKEIREAVPYGISFKTVNELQHYIHHLCYIFDMPIHYKAKHTFLGIFWFKCASKIKKCGFHLKFTRITNNHLITLKLANLYHNHSITAIAEEASSSPTNKKQCKNKKKNSENITPDSNNPPINDQNTINLEENCEKEHQISKSEQNYDQSFDIICSDDSDSSLQLMISENQKEMKQDADLIEIIKENSEVLKNLDESTLKYLSFQDKDVGVVLINNQAGKEFIEDTALLRYTSNVSLYEINCCCVQLLQINSSYHLRIKAFCIFQKMTSNNIQLFIKYCIENFSCISTFICVPSPYFTIDINSIKKEYNKSFLYCKYGLYKYMFEIMKSGRPISQTKLQQIIKELFKTSSTEERECVINSITKHSKYELNLGDIEFRDFLLANIKYFCELDDACMPNSKIFCKKIFTSILKEYDSFLMSQKQIDKTFIDSIQIPIELSLKEQYSILKSILIYKHEMLYVLRFLDKNQDNCERKETKTLKNILEEPENAFICSLLKDYTPMIAYKVIKSYIKSNLCRCTLPDKNVRISKIYPESCIPK